MREAVPVTLGRIGYGSYAEKFGLESLAGGRGTEEHVQEGALEVASPDGADRFAEIENHGILPDELHGIPAPGIEAAKQGDKGLLVLLESGVGECGALGELGTPSVCYDLFAGRLEEDEVELQRCAGFQGLLGIADGVRSVERSDVEMDGDAHGAEDPDPGSIELQSLSLYDYLRWDFNTLQHEGPGAGEQGRREDQGNEKCPDRA